MKVSSDLRRIWTPADRRHRLIQRHRLSAATRASRAEDVGESLVAIHSTDPATVFLSVAARLDHADPVADLERAMYLDRTLIRMHGMRKTIFVFPAELAPAIQVSTTSGHATRLRFEFLRDLAMGDPDWTEPWLIALESEILAYLDTHGETSGLALSKAIPNLRNDIVYDRGTPKEIKQGIASRVFRGLANENRIARGRPLGTWISGQYRWSIGLPHTEIGIAQARTDLIRRWLTQYGPGTLNDMKWWTGWSLRDLRAALSGLDIEDVQLTKGMGHLLAGDSEPEAEAAPDLVLLPGLDSTSMGYRHRDFYLEPAYVPDLFDYSGNIGPTIWWGGRIVGVWAQRKDGEIVWRWLESVPSEANTALTWETARLATWMGSIRCTPRYRTRIERYLVS